MPVKNTFDIGAYCDEMEKYLGDQDGEAHLFWQAMSFAVYAHEKQIRKSGEAYVSHPCEVAKILVKELGVRNPQALAAAMLHDTVEDVPEVTNEVIGEMFGRNIEAIVDGCTKISHFSGDRQTFYKVVHRKIFSGAASRIDTMLVKLADRLHNLRTMQSMPKHKRQKIAEETLDVYAPMATVMGLYGLKRELYDLALSYKFPRQSSKVLASIKKLEVHPDVLAIKEKLEDRMEQVWLTCNIKIKTKGLWSYYEPTHKLLAKEIEYPMEIIVEVDDLQNCYRALGIVNQNFPPIPRTIRDFIANPKPSGYQCLHARANIRGQNYLFKIRTPEMGDIAQAGIVHSWTTDGKVPGDFARELSEMFTILGSDEGISYREMIAASGKKEIYTYTPEGDRICLPRQSIVLDFAYKVHTEVGNRCIRAMIGRREARLDDVLMDGDRIKIICSENSVDFDPKVQKLCQSPKARSNLAKTFKFRWDSMARGVGKSVLSQEMKKYGIPWDILKNDVFFEFLEHFGLEELDELFIQIGEGGIALKNVIEELKSRYFADKDLPQPPTGVFNSFSLSNLDPVCIKLSRCCNPNPCEKGLLSLLSERGFSIHRNDCRKIRDLKIQREDVIELKWKLRETNLTKSQTIIISEISRKKLLSILEKSPSEMKIFELTLLSKFQAKKQDWEVKFNTANLRDLKKILSFFKKSKYEYEFILEH
jgi:GTP diphosphokinase / guanosine-3',5'-bis(diphosphate) 3'-diphosphatase